MTRLTTSATTSAAATASATESATELFRRAPDRHLDVGDAEVAYRRLGRGPDVLFVHGWPVSGATFRSLLPHLTDHVTCHVIDLPGSGSSRFDDRTDLSVEAFIRGVRRVLDLLEMDRVAVVGHDSGGLIARHAFAGDRRVRAIGLLDTEQPSGLGWRFRLFLLARHIPGAGGALGWVSGRRRLRRSRLVLGGAFADPGRLDGEFDELFLRPLREDPERRRASIAVLRSFDVRLVRELGALHRRITVPVQMVWGAQDAFFPLGRAKEMVGTFPRADLAVVEGAGLFAHEERPAEVARALVPLLSGGAVRSR
jgi:pimeloyl-ACP methyl ester carboxylesterase